MRVILLQDIEKLGKKYAVKEVADGYARNYLIPQGLAKPATGAALEWAKEEQEAEKRQAEGELERVGKIASEIDGLEVEIPVKIGDKGQFFEKITPQKISHKLKEIGFDIKKSQIELSKEIEELGEFEVKIKFEHKLETQIKVIVVEDIGVEDKA